MLMLYMNLLSRVGSPIFPFIRRRRQTLESLDPRIERIFEAALDNDPSGCVLQLTCAIGRIPRSSLNGRVKDFRIILRLVHAQYSFIYNPDLQVVLPVTVWLYDMDAEGRSRI